MSSIKLKIKQLFQQKSQRRPTPKASELPAQQQKQQQQEKQQPPRHQPPRPRPNQETSEQFQTKNLASDRFVNQENEKPMRYNSSTSTSSLPPPPYNENFNYSDEQRQQFQDFHVNLPVPPNVLPMTIFEITEQRRMQRTNQHPEFC